MCVCACVCACLSCLVRETKPTQQPPFWGTRKNIGPNDALLAGQGASRSSKLLQELLCCSQTRLSYGGSETTRAWKLWKGQPSSLDPEIRGDITFWGHTPNEQDLSDKSTDPPRRFASCHRYAAQSARINPAPPI